MKYNIGDKVLYPMHGAGIIEAIEEKKILGELHAYYVMRLGAGDMKVMIPMGNAAEIGVRDIVTGEEADEVIRRFADQCEECDSNWNKRYRENMVKIRSGDIYQVLGVVKSLMHRDRKKRLSTGERKMLNSAKQILYSELTLAGAAEPDDIEKMLEETVETEIAAAN